MLYLGPNNPNGQTTKANSTPVVLPTEQETILSAIAKDGTDITSPTAMPAGGIGIRGWLSAIWTKLNGVLDISDRAGRLLGVLGTGSNIIGKVGIDQTTDGTTNLVRLAAETTKVIGTVNIVATQTIAAVTAITNPLPAGTNKVGTVDIAGAPATAKGTQGALFTPTQDAKDAGRTTIALTIEGAGAATTEGLATVTESRNGATATTFTSKTITSGKRIRFTSVALEVETLGSGTAPQRMYIRLRVNTAGATTATSPQQSVWAVVNNNAIVKSGNTVAYNIPDGVEFLGDGTATYGITIQFPDFVATTGTVQGKISLTAFEY